MDVIRRYLEDNPDLFAALVAALAIIGGLAGNVIGARIQAAGGRDQARAAREAAETTAEAQRVAALWTVRQVQTAEFMRYVHELKRIADSFYMRESTVELRAQAGDAYQAMTQKCAEIQLTAPASLAESAERVRKKCGEIVERAISAGPGVYVLRLLSDLAQGDDPATERLARQAARAITDYRFIYMSNGDIEARHRAALRVGEELGVVPSVTREQITALMLNINFPDSRPSSEALTEQLTEEMTALIESARTMLRSADGLAVE
ncbi:hypothetical protein [Streptomyces sp. NPDC047968]|uniref:hypothetical protein n=1 Tax=unclassified Streptomyces TaxID=2593676 RepID=UPI00342CE809